MFSTLSDRYLVFALVTGAVALVLTALLIILTMALHISLRQREKHDLKFTALWRPILMNALVDPAACELPVLQVSDHLRYLKLWNYLQESLRGEATDSLNQVAIRLRCDALAQRLLRHGNRAERLLAIVTLGNLRDHKSWDELLATAASHDHLASLNAARALIQIDSIAGVTHLTPLVLSRQDWEIPRVACMLGDARTAFGQLLTRTIVRLKDHELLRALQLVEALRIQLPTATLLHLLHPQQPPAALAAALRVADGTGVLVKVRAYLQHPDWRVRAQAVHALSRLGEPSDVTLLTARLGDAEWWVRYYTAQALSNLPYLGREGLAALQSSVTEPAARQILAQVCAERGIASHSN